MPNDVIVTTQGQTAGGSQSPPPVAFNQVAHTSGLPNSASLIGTVLSNANVLNQPQVATMVVCLLLSSGTGTCNQGGAVAGAGALSVQNSMAESPAQDGSQSTSSPVQGSLHLDQSLASMPDPQQPLILGEANEVPINIHDPNLTELTGVQRAAQINGDKRYTQMIGEGAEGDVKYPILRHSDGTAYILVVPLRLGSVTINLFGRTGSGALWSKDLVFEVEAPDRQPDELLISLSGVIPISLSESSSPSFLSPQIRYKGLSETIDLPPSAISFKLRSKDGAEIVRLDENTGRLTPLRLGHALLESKFKGATNFTCIAVTQDSMRPPPIADSFCVDVLRPEESLTIPKKMVIEPPQAKPNVQ